MPPLVLMKKELAQVALLQIRGGDGFKIVTAPRKSDRSFIGAFLPDLFSEIYQFFLHLSYSDDGQYEWFSCANSSISMPFSSVQPILSCESRFSESRWKRS